MAQVQPVTTLNIDGQVLNVADLSGKVQGLVGVYNDWNQDLADAQTKFLQVQAALNDLSRQIILQVKQDEADAAKAAADAAAAATPAVTTDASPVVTNAKE